MNRLKLMMSIVALIAGHASATVTCVTDKSTGSSTTAADCATCESALKGCCYYTTGDCKPKLAMAFTAPDFEPSSPATGHGTLGLDVVAAMLNYDLSIEGLIAPEIGAVIVGPPGPTGVRPLLYDLPTGNHKIGMFALMDFPGYPRHQQVIDILAGRWVIVVRSAAHPTGELFGPIELAPLCPGDASGDGAVNFSDVTNVLVNFGGGWYEGDADGDGQVNFADIAAVLVNFNSACD